MNDKDEKMKEGDTKDKGDGVEDKKNEKKDEQEDVEGESKGTQENISRRCRIRRREKIKKERWARNKAMNFLHNYPK